MHPRLPSNIEAEEICISLALLDSKRVVPELLELLKPNHFYHPKTRKIFAAISRMSDRGDFIDIVTVANELESTKEMEGIGRLYLNRILDSTSPFANVADYAKIIREKAMLRFLISSGERITELGFMEKEEASAQLDKAIEILSTSTLDASASTINTIIDAIESWNVQVEELRSGGTGLTLGYPSLDKHVRGANGQVIVAAGLPGMGKTSFLLNVISRQAEMGVPCAIISLEMTKEAVVERLLQMETGATADELQYKPAVAREAIERLSKKPIKVIAMGTTSAAGIIRQMRLLYRQGVRSFMVDYLQLMSFDGAERRDLEIGVSLRMLLLFAKGHDCCVLTGSQINRAAITNEGGSPKIHNMKESGAIESHSDIILGIHRPGYHNNDNSYEMYAEILKNRKRGFVGNRIAFNFNPTRQRIEESALGF